MFQKTTVVTGLSYRPLLLLGQWRYYVVPKVKISNMHVCDHHNGPILGSFLESSF